MHKMRSKSSGAQGLKLPTQEKGSAPKQKPPVTQCKEKEACQYYITGATQEERTATQDPSLEAIQAL